MMMPGAMHHLLRHTPMMGHSPSPSERLLALGLRLPAISGRSLFSFAEGNEQCGDDDHRTTTTQSDVKVQSR
jgi:hypothetical protein